MDEIWKYIGLQYEVLSGTDKMRGVCTDHWLYETESIWANAAITYSKLANASISINNAVLTTTAGGGLQVNGDNIITQRDIEALKLEISELREKLKDK